MPPLATATTASASAIGAVRARPIAKLRAVVPLFTIVKTTGPTGTLLGVIVDCDSLIDGRERPMRWLNPFTVNAHSAAPRTARDEFASL
ncbi:MAG: hypothetical protein M3P18_25150 [Actinomycetota bacterium]|nr:hypothetical protein [Actinomycetota bacterium]